MSYGSKFENKTVEIQAGRSKLDLIVPKELNAESGASGKLSVTLLSIQDGDGRVRKLPAPTVEVDIHRQKPTVRFAKAGRNVIVEGESAQAPLRLTGDAPWEVTYSLNGGKAKKVSLRDANNHLTLSDAGIYRLVEVKDANCPGTVAQDDTFEIAYKPRPKVEIVDSGSISLVGGTWKHKGFCTGGEDQVALRFNGESRPLTDSDCQDKDHTRLHTDTLRGDIPVAIPSSPRKRPGFCTYILNRVNIDTISPSSKISITQTTRSSSLSSIMSTLGHRSRSLTPTRSLSVLIKISKQMPRSGWKVKRHSRSISLFANQLLQRSYRIQSPPTTRNGNWNYHSQSKRLGGMKSRLYPCQMSRIVSRLFTRRITS